MLFHIVTFHSFTSGVYFWVSMIILVEINLKGFLWKCVKKACIYGHNHRVEQLTISERYWETFNKSKSLRYNLNTSNYVLIID